MTAVAIVTGAGSGIGRATAKALSDAGYAVALVGRDEARLRQAAAGMPPERALLVPADLTQPGAAQRVVDAVLARFHRLDVLVNNAGDAAQAPIEATTRHTWDRLFDLNAVAPALLIAAAWPTFKAQERGVVVNVSSLAAHDPFQGFFVYGASKAALESLVRSVANEGVPGVRAYNVAAGVIDTGMVPRVFGEDLVPKEKRRPPEDVAALVLRCASGDLNERSGSTLVLPNL